MPEPRPTVHVVDDDAAVREALALLLDTAGMHAIAHASAREFLASANLAGPGCAVVDVRMPGMSGLELQEELNRRGAGLPVVLITGHGEIRMAVAALKAGAVDFLEKPFDEDLLLAAVREAVGRAGRQTSGSAADTLRARRDQLTPREREVMELVVAGHPNKVVGTRLGISARTVEIHRARVMEKMGARTLSELVRMALALE